MRRIVSAKIKFLSLVPRGANQLPVIYKSDDAATDNSVSFSSLVKATNDFDEKGELLSVVYAPEMIDSQGDIASEETIKEMMYDAAKDGFDLDIRHDGKALSKDDAFVAESFVIQKGDPRFAEFKNYSDETVDVTGGWATVIKIQNEGLRKAYRDGKWNGVSMAGDGVFAAEKQDLNGFAKKLAQLIKTNNTSDGDLDMDRKELETILKERDAELTTSIVEKVTAAMKPKEEDKTKPVAKEGDDPKPEDVECPVKKPVLKDATDPASVAKYQKQLASYKLAKEVDWDDPEQVANYHKAISEEAPTDTEAGVEKEDTDEVASLKRQLAKAQRSSNAGSGGGDSPQGEIQHSSGGLSKEDMTLMLAGQKAGEAHTKQMGHR